MAAGAGMTQALGMSRPQIHASESYATTGALSAHRLAVGRREGSVEVYTLDSLEMTLARQLFVPGESSASTMAFSEDEELLAVLGSDGRLLLWHLASNTLETHPVQRAGRDASLVFQGESRALMLILAGDVPHQAVEEDGMVRRWWEPASDTLVMQVRDGVATRVIVEGTWTGLPGSPGWVQRWVDDAQVMEVWHWEGAGLQRSARMTATRSEPVLALSPSGRWALMRHASGRVLKDFKTGVVTPLPETWSGDVLGFVDEETCVVFEYGLLRIGTDGSCVRTHASAPQSEALAVSRAFLLERSGFAREQLIALDGSAVQVVAEHAQTEAHVCLGAAALDIVSMTHDQAHGAYSHGAAQPSCLLEGSALPLFSLSVSGDGQVAVGLDQAGVVHRWRRMDGVKLGEGALFTAEAQQGCLPKLTLNYEGTVAVEQNQLLRRFDLERFAETGRFAYQKKRGDAPVEDPDAALDAKAARKVESAWDAFFAVRAAWNPSLTLSASGTSVYGVDEGALLSIPLEGGKRKRLAAPENARAVCLMRDGSHAAFSTASGAALYQLAPYKQLASWAREDAGLLADAEGAWMVLTRGHMLEVCAAKTGALRWRCATPSFARPGQASIYLHADGARLVLAHGAEVVVLEERAGEGAERLKVVCLPRGELLAVGEAGWWATPHAFDHGHVSLDGRAANNASDALALLGAPNPRVLEALLLR